MNLKKIAIGLVIAYASVVILFESLLGFYQPQAITNHPNERWALSLTSVCMLPPIIGPVLGIVKPWQIRRSW